MGGPATWMLLAVAKWAHVPPSFLTWEAPAGTTQAKLWPRESTHFPKEACFLQLQLKQIYPSSGCGKLLWLPDTGAARSLAPSPTSWRGMLNARLSPFTPLQQSPLKKFLPVSSSRIIVFNLWCNSDTKKVLKWQHVLQRSRNEILLYFYHTHLYMCFFPPLEDAWLGVKRIGKHAQRKMWLGWGEKSPFLKLWSLRPWKARDNTWELRGGALPVRWCGLVGVGVNTWDLGEEIGSPWSLKMDTCVEQERLLR